jgi:hypothetical protein
MSEIVERVARAMLPAFAHIPDPEYRLTIASCWARAAIEAMRKPTPEMNSAGNLMDSRIRYVNATDVWHAMIDAALQHKEL